MNNLSEIINKLNEQESTQFNFLRLYRGRLVYSNDKYELSFEMNFYRDYSPIEGIHSLHFEDDLMIYDCNLGDYIHG